MGHKLSDALEATSTLKATVLNLIFKLLHFFTGFLGQNIFHAFQLTKDLLDVQKQTIKPILLKPYFVICNKVIISFVRNKSYQFYERLFFQLRKYKDVFSSHLQKMGKF
jgi:hypothetical protein